MTNITDAHSFLVEFCRDDPGVAIGEEMFTYLVNRAIGLVNSRPVNYPLTTRFQNMEIDLLGKIDPLQMKVFLDKSPAPPGEAPRPVVIVKDIVFNVEISLNGVLMSTQSIKYTNITGGVSVSAKRIALVGERSYGNWGAANEAWRNMPTLPDGSIFTQDLVDEWVVQERAIKLIAKDLLGPTLLESVEIPNVIKMLTSIEFVGAIRVGGEKELIMFSGPAVWDVGCPRRPANLSDTSSNLTTSVRVRNDGARVLDGRLSPEDPNASYPEPPDSPEVPQLASADVFTYLPRTFVQKRFDGIAKPATGLNDDGYVGPIYWHYESGILVTSINLKMTSLWPLEFKLELPSKGFGVAGAGVKVGCVYYEAAGVAFNGEIDPFEFFFRLGQDVNAAELYFESRFGQVIAHDYQFHHWPPADFPIDQIVDFILARVTEMQMSGKSHSVLNVTRFALIKYDALRGFGSMQPGMAAEKSSDAVTIGVVFKK